MPRNGSGSYSLPQPAFVPNTTISSSAVNSDFSDIGLALTASIAADGQTSITGQLKFPTGTVGLPAHTFETDTTSGMYYPSSGILGFSGLATGLVYMNANNIGTGKSGALLTYANGSILNPVGQVSEFAGGTAPVGWLLCYGQAISRATYPELFFVIGTTYGSGDGTTTFNLPDLRGRAVFGKDDMGGVAANRITVAGGNFDGTVLGGTGGAQNRTLATANLAAHNHTATSTTTTGITDPGHLHTVTDPGHTHTITDPAHTHTVSDPTHTHTITDPAHRHNINDPGHIHSVTDPRHRHQNDVGSAAGSAQSTIGAASASSTLNTAIATSATGVSVDSNTTGITQSQNNTTGITNVGAATGVTNTNAFTGITGANSHTTGISIVSTTTGITATSTTTTTTTNAGSGTAFSILSPAIIMNRIIFAGRP